jgi:hypothetical protein
MVATALGAGLAVGFITLAGSLMIMLPVSWVMNRFVYHNTLMRILLGVATGSASVFAFILIVAGCLLGFFGKPYYFGLFPTYMSSGDTAPVGWMAPLIRVWNAVAHPIKLRMESKEDRESLLTTMNTFLVPDTTMHMKGDIADGAASALYTLSQGKMAPRLPILADAVCEPFFEAARIAGSQNAPAAWKETMQKLGDTKVGNFLFAQQFGEVPGQAAADS